MPKTSARGKTGPRKKTGCLPCRARHLRCTEEHPTCAACRKSGLKCERNPVIVYAPGGGHDETSSNEQVAPDDHADSWPVAEDLAEVPFLLRHFQDGIATWMDLFDDGMNYQRTVVRKATQSELLRCCICALASKQLALVTKTKRWRNAAEEWYGNSLRLLLDALKVQGRLDSTVPASILLLSYELMNSPGIDYTRHFHGAKHLIESNFEQIAKASTDGSAPLTLASYWFFIRHDVDIAMANRSPLAIDPRFWLPLTQEDNEEGMLGDKALLLMGRCLELRRKENEDAMGEGTKQLKSIFDEIGRWNKAASSMIQPFEVRAGIFWYPTSAGAAARQIVLAAELFALSHQDPQESNGNGQNPRERILACAEEIVSISESFPSDAAQVQAVHTLFQAALNNDRLRGRVIKTLEELQTKTGFSTEAKVKQLQHNSEFMTNDGHGSTLKRNVTPTSPESDMLLPTLLSAETPTATLSATC